MQAEYIRTNKNGNSCKIVDYATVRPIFRARLACQKLNLLSGILETDNAAADSSTTDNITKSILINEVKLAFHTLYRIVCGHAAIQRPDNEALVNFAKFCFDH